jgi:hypothetical protein
MQVKKKPVQNLNYGLFRQTTPKKSVHKTMKKYDIPYMPTYLQQEPLNYISGGQNKINAYQNLNDNLLR